MRAMLAPRSDWRLLKIIAATGRSYTGNGSAFGLASACAGEVVTSSARKRC